MKKNILLVMVAATITLCQAQEADSRDKLYLGFKAGYNLSKVYDIQGEQFEAKSKMGFAGGVFMSVPVGRYLGVHPEIMFSQRGFRGTGMLLGTPYDLTRTTSYLDFPFLVAFKPIQVLTLLAGPQFSYTLKQRDVFKNSTTTVQQEEEFNNDNIRKNTLCLLSGFDINIDRAVLGVRIGRDLQKNNGDGTSATPRYKNVWLQATMGFRF